MNECCGVSYEMCAKNPLRKIVAVCSQAGGRRPGRRYCSGDAVLFYDVMTLWPTRIACRSPPGTAASREAPEGSAGRAAIFSHSFSARWG